MKGKEVEPCISRINNILPKFWRCPKVIDLYASIYGRHSFIQYHHQVFIFQDKMADHMKTYLGSMLYTDPVEDHRTALPSPEELKQKILVSKR
jgi:hypothetical protein